MENITESCDESFLRWRVSIEEGDQGIDLEEFESEQLLKTVVRTSYLYHLRQSLRKNLEASKQKNNYAVEETLVNKVIKGCSALLEEKALRHCMIAKLYQRVMAQTIKEVKKATSDCDLFTPLKQFAEHSKSAVSNVQHKEVQTELDNTILLANLCSQTEALLQQINPLTKNIDIHRNPINCLLPNNQYTKSINGVFRPEPSFHDAMDSSRVDLNDIEEKTAIKRKKCDHFDFSDEEIVNADSTTVKPDIFASTVPAEDTKPLSVRINTFEVKLRSATFADSVALLYNLECEIEELPPAKKQKLEEKFVQLFGPDHAVDYYGLTSEQKSIACRKRIAKFVVIELTNFYIKKRIASKQLFKILAKHITSVLLGRSLYPSPEEIKRSVEEFFLDNRIINSEDDFYL